MIFFRDFCNWELFFVFFFCDWVLSNLGGLGNWFFLGIFVIGSLIRVFRYCSFKFKKCCFFNFFFWESLYLGI